MLKCLIKWLNSQFAREKASQTDRGLDVEFGERPDAELGELVDESRESEKPKH